MFEDDSSSDESDTEESEDTGSPPASPCRSPLPSTASAGESRSLMSEAAGESVCPPALMILDWDDTLYPTSAIGAAGYDVTDPRALEPGLARQIGQHCDAVLQFLQLVSERADRVVMVTNSQEGWVELSGGAYAPRLLEALDGLNIPVISSQQLYAKDTACPFEWKRACFADLAQKYAQEMQARGVQNAQLISVGDGEFERLAAEACAEKIGDKVAIKTIKFDDEPSVARLQQQIEYVTEQVDSVFQGDRPQRRELCDDCLEEDDADERQSLLPPLQPRGGDAAAEHWGGAAGGTPPAYLAPSFLQGGTSGGMPGRGWRVTGGPDGTDPAYASMPSTCGGGLEKSAGSSGAEHMWITAAEGGTL